MRTVTLFCCAAIASPAWPPQSLQRDRLGASASTRQPPQPRRFCGAGRYSGQCFSGEVAETMTPADTRMRVQVPAKTTCGAAPQFDRRSAKQYPVARHAMQLPEQDPEPHIPGHLHHSEVGRNGQPPGGAPTAAPPLMNSHGARPRRREEGPRPRSLSVADVFSKKAACREDGTVRERSSSSTAGSWTATGCTSRRSASRRSRQRPHHHH
jgi:hypothetical protein